MYSFVFLCLFTVMLWTIASGQTGTVVVPDYRIDVEIRLVAVTGAAAQGEGRLEVRRKGSTNPDAWGTVCDDRWNGDQTNANVACRQLGYDSGEKFFSYSYNSIEAANLTIHLDDLSCNGTEVNLGHCMTQAWDLNNCDHTEDVILQCRKKTYLDLELRLREGLLPDSGLLEVRQRGSENWGTVCDDGWFSYSNALVACRSMGYKWGERLDRESYPSGAGEIFLDNVVCTGREDYLANCSMGKWAFHDCAHYEDIGLICYRSTAIVPPHSVLGQNNTQQFYGVVDLAVDKNVFSVCDDQWDAQDARVACRELNRTYSKALCCSQYARIDSMSEFNHSIVSMQCTGSESKLIDCPRTMQNGSCSYQKQASVICSNEPIPEDADIPIRLLQANASVFNYGRAQVRRYGLWSDICTTINDTEASVICRQLGYASGFAAGSFNVAADVSTFYNLSCKGSETKVKDCRFNWTSGGFCQQFERAVVLCSTVADEAAECRRTMLGMEYMGRLNRTTTGRTCQRWDEQYPQAHDYNVSATFPEGNVRDAANYCRNPDGWYQGLWCFTTDPKKRWDLCTLPLCNSSDCRYDTVGAHYHGNLSTTAQGLTCQRWDSQSPHDHEMTNLFPSGTISQAENFCRNPDEHHEGPWCYTTDPDVRWQLCNVPYCGFGCKQSDVGHEYVGTVSTTTSGLSCQRWDTNSPHNVPDQYNDDMNADGSPSKAENFCRNPSYDLRGPWCYTTDPRVEREFCNIPRCSSLQARLADGGDNYGRVELRINGVWGTVCDDIWDSYGATVVCRQMGFYSGQAVTGSRYGVATGPIHINRVECMGTESNLIRCRMSAGDVGTNQTRCAQHYNDAGAVCHGRTRLKYGGNVYSDRDHVAGVVLVFVNNDWSLVCGQTWTDREAVVTCRELGYPYGQAMCCNTFGNQFLYTLSFSAACVGNETSLYNCATNTTCAGSYRNYGSVYCSKVPIPTSRNFSISLDAGSNGYEGVNGKVVVHQSGEAGTICGAGWTDREANVVCKQLGLRGGVAFAFIRNYADDEELDYPVMMDNVVCAGTETHLEQCTYTNRTSCASTVRAGVLCYNRTRGVQYRLSGGNARSQGRVEISYDGIWGTVCINEWSRYDAMTLCKSLNYTGGETMWNNYKSIGAPRYVSGLQCTMAEPTLLTCPNNGWRTAVTATCDEAAASCFNNTRLAFKVASMKDVIGGQVNAYMRATWNTVCGAGFDQNAATVVCREMGFAYGVSEPGLYVVKSVTANVYANVRCLGTEATFSECRSDFGEAATLCPDVLSNQAAGICAGHQLINTYVQSNITNRSINHTGYVELDIYGIKAAVCWAVFDDRAASVVCRAAGYRQGVSLRSLLPFSQSYRWVIKFGCTGSENSLSNCTQTRTPQQVSNCLQVDSVANAVCYNEALRYRLSGTVRNIGRVEIYHDGTWGSVCCIRCTDHVASVACRQLGYSGGVLSRVQVSSSATLDVLAAIYMCNGTESSLLSCTSSWSQGLNFTCAESSYLTVQCIQDSMILGGRHTGMVQYAYQNRLVDACRQSFTDHDASVACRANGYYLGGKSMQCADYPRTTSEQVSRFDCVGSEQSLNECRAQVQAYDQCTSKQAAVVRCFTNEPNQIESDFRLFVNSTTRWLLPNTMAIGQLMLNVSGVQGRIGAANWDDRNADLACRSLGYATGMAYKHGPSAAKYPFWADNVNCSGTEPNFIACIKNRLYPSATCNTSVEAGVICMPNSSMRPTFRLVGGSNFAGRLVVTVLGYSGGLCSDGFGATEATVACRHFGKKTGRISYSDFGSTDQIFVLQGLTCSGSEQNLMECVMGGDSFMQCPSFSEVKLECFDDVYITGGPLPHYGIVQMAISDQIYGVCDDGFDRTAAQVVCRGLGYGDGKNICCRPFGDVNLAQSFINNVRCLGTEKSLLNCTYDRSLCKSANYSSVYCTTSIINATAAVNYRIMGNTAMTGEVAVYNRGFWGRVCNDFWDDADAQAFCKNFGYQGGIAYQYAKKVQNPIVWGSFNCTGVETSLLQCPYADVSQTGGCSDYSLSAGVLCYRSTSAPAIRLAGGGANHGRVEMSYDGVWGTICNEMWSTYDVNVLCRQLSNNYVGGTVVDSSSYRRGAGPIYMSRTQCSNKETSIFRCLNSGWMQGAASACNSHSKDAAVWCDGKVKLSKNWYGQVLVYVDNHWGLVCSKDWDQNDADVVCRSLGFASAYPICCSAFGLSFASYAMYGAACTGSEGDLLSCPHQSGGECGSSGYASVVCGNETARPQSYTSLRISEGDRSSGVLEIQYAGVWGRVCTDGWTDTDAQVVCRELGFSNGMAYTHYKSFWTSGNEGLFWTSRVDCHGMETSLNACQKTAYGAVRDCANPHAAGVLCYRFQGIYFRLAGGQCSGGRMCLNEGVVQVSVNNTWGNLCESYWDDNSARVLCRSQGYDTGISLASRERPQYQRDPQGIVWKNEIYCNGSELSLQDCPHTAWRAENVGNYATCPSHSDAAVFCFGSVRLHNSSTAVRTKSGAVQVYIQDVNRWGYVCSENFTDYTARRVCQELGYYDGVSVCCNAYGNLFGDTNLTRSLAQCNSNSARIKDCAVQFNCSVYASVVCLKQDEAANKNSYRFYLDPASPSHGRVMISYLGQTGRICSNGWDDTDAAVFCNSIGFSYGIAQRMTGMLSGTRLPYLASEFRCDATSRSFEGCPFKNGSTMGNCSDSLDAGVFCYNGGEIAYRLGSIQTNGTARKYMGRVEIRFNDVWGTVCDRSWEKNDSAVFCKSLGENFNDGDPVFATTGGSGPIWLSHLGCTGIEPTLHACAHPGFNNSFVTSTSYCSHSNDAGVVCYKNVRLNQLFTRYRVLSTFGTVEVYQGNGWALVCDEAWDDTDAAVVCRELGYQNGRAALRSSFGIPAGNVQQKFTSVRCTGAETSLAQCSKTQTDSCPGANYAGAYCSQDAFPDISFSVNTSAVGYGIVGVTVNGVNGRVCNNGWDTAEANVTCRTLGYLGGVPYSHPTLDLRPVILSNVSCTGRETDLRQCMSTNWGDAYACRGDGYEAGVVCYNSSFTMRLSDGDRGRLELELDGVWGTVCSIGFGRTDARVLCRQLGYKDGTVVKDAQTYTPGVGKIWLSMVNCNGTESHLLACPSAGWGSTSTAYYCDSHRNDVRVQCIQEEIAITQIRLADGGSNYGRVEVFASGLREWGTVCDDSWDDRDATVVCRMLGYRQGVAFPKAKYGVGAGRIMLDDVVCTGEEQTVNDCEFTGIGDHNCQHSEDASVVCQDSINPVVTNPTRTDRPPAPTETVRVATLPWPEEPFVVGESHGSHSGSVAAAVIVPILLIAAAVGAGVFLYRRYGAVIKRQVLRSTSGGASNNEAPVSIDNVMYGMNIDEHSFSAGASGLGAPGSTPGISISDNSNLVKYAAPMSDSSLSESNFSNPVYGLSGLNDVTNHAESNA